MAEIITSEPELFGKAQAETVAEFSVRLQHVADRATGGLLDSIIEIAAVLGIDLTSAEKPVHHGQYVLDSLQRLSDVLCTNYVTASAR